MLRESVTKSKKALIFITWIIALGLNNDPSTGYTGTFFWSSLKMIWFFQIVIKGTGTVGFSFLIHCLLYCTGTPMSLGPRSNGPGCMPWWRIGRRRGRSPPAASSQWVGPAYWPFSALWSPTSSSCSNSKKEYECGPCSQIRCMILLKFKEVSNLLHNKI